MPPASRIGDMHVCPMVIPGTPPIPHVGGPVMAGSANVMIGGVPAARVGDACLCTPVGPSDSIIKGSMTVFINNMPATRMGDSTAHGGTVVAGMPTVIIGDSARFEPPVPGKPGGGMATSLMDSPLMRGAAMTAGKAQRRALKAAAKSGVPFCLVCQGKSSH